MLAVAGLIVGACASTGSSASSVPSVPATPIAGASTTATATATPAGSGSPVTVASGESIELSVGGSATVDGTGVTFEVIQASGPAAGCNDCPNLVRLQVTCPPDNATLDYAFSGGMSEAALESARKKSACGLQFYVVQVQEDSATIRVDPA